MSKIIFGSGIVGLLAKEILGDDWKIIPFSRSRFFSFSPALDDNYIIRDEKIDDFMIDHLKAAPKHFYKISYSIGGQLESYSAPFCETWLNKIFGPDAPPQAAPYMKSRTTFFIYDIRINELYEALQNKYQKELEANADLAVDEIGDHHFTSHGTRHDFDVAINTIPFGRIIKLCGLNMTLETKQVWYYHIATPDLDFEGANQVLVVDPEFVFYKVNNVAPNRYIFHCLQDVPVPGPYFMQFMARFDLLDGTTIAEVIPVGTKPSPKQLRQLGVLCVGAHAEHDWCADVGSNIISLLRIKSRFG